MMATFSFLTGVKWHRVLLLLGSFLAAVAALILHYQGLLPFDLPTFLFFTFVLFLFALYRLGWVFLLLVGVVPLEIINVAPPALGGVTLRPYQWLAVILMAAVFLRFVSGRLPFQIIRPQWFDLFPLVLALGAFTSLGGAPGSALAFKQALVVTSFVLVYALGRIFFRTLHDIRQAAPFFIVSSFATCGYALWQNIRFLGGRESFQVMAGRPNGTFGEADWLGMFMLPVLGVGLGLLFLAMARLLKKPKRPLPILIFFGAELYMVLIWIVLIITVARSAWLGASALVAGFFWGVLFWRGKSLVQDSWRSTSLFVVATLFSLLVAVGVVFWFHLSPFQFLNRIESTGSGWQKITVSCDSAATALPQKLHSMEELTWNHCRHIRLEDIEQEQQNGRFIQEVYRPDPNVAIRRKIYGQVFGILKEYPLLGIGWGSASAFLGTDEQGTGLNASNVFLEVWLGSGLLGFLAFVSWWGLLAYGAFRQYRATTLEGERLFALSFFSAWLGLTVFDLFNSGILLGFFFLFLAAAALTLEKK